MPEQEDKFAALMQMFEQGKKVTQLFFEAETAQKAQNLAETERLFRELIEAQKQHVDLAKRHNAQFPDSPYDLPPIVQPLVNSLFRCADILEAGGEQNAAANVLREEAVTYSEKYLSPIQLADAKRSQIPAMLQQARFNEALVTLAEVRDVFRSENDVPKMARVILDRADLLHWLGDTPRAKQELAEAADAVAPLIQGDASPEHGFLSAVMQSIQDIQTGAGDGKRGVDAAELYRARLELDFYRGLVNKTNGDYDEALRLFQKVLPEYEKTGSAEAIHSQIAAIYAAQGKFQESLEIVGRVEPAFHQNILLRPKLAVLWKIKAEALFGLEQFDEALAFVNQAISEHGKHPDPDVSWKTLFLKAQILAAKSQREQALDAFRQAAKIIDNLRKSPLGYRLDSTYLNDKIPAFNAAIRLAVKLQDEKTACEFIEMVKARTLTAALSVGNQEGARSDDQAKRNLHALTRRIDALEYQAYREGDADGKLGAEREVLLAERKTVLEKIRYADPRWGHITEPPSLDFAEILKLVTEKSTAVLNLYRTDDKIYHVLLKDGKAETACLPFDQKLLQTDGGALSEYIANLYRKDQAFDFHYDPAELGLNADKFIPEQLLQKAFQAKNLVIVPHKELHLLPWGSITYAGKRLFEYIPICVLPNLSSLKMLSGTDFENDKVVLFGDPQYDGIGALSESAIEVKKIGELHRSARKSVENFQQEQASEKNFRDILERNDARNSVLHVACHGEFEASEPMTSGLLLSDGRIDAAEIADSGMQFDEVILSACSCGWRPTEVDDVQLAGDDILGLPGAFLEAGAKAVLLSICRADDKATRALMIDYHQNRIRGKSPSEALQAAQKTLLANPEFQPYQWAGFTLYASPI